MNLLADATRRWWGFLLLQLHGCCVISWTLDSVAHSIDEATVKQDTSIDTQRQREIEIETHTHRKGRSAAAATTALVDAMMRLALAPSVTLLFICSTLLSTLSSLSALYSLNSKVTRCEWVSTSCAGGEAARGEQSVVGDLFTWIPPAAADDVDIDVGVDVDVATLEPEGSVWQCAYVSLLTPVVSEWS